MRKILAGLAFIAALAGFTHAFAQAPGPVPALPDAERRTSAVLSGSVGPVNVGFAVYGDGTDYGNWLEVLCNNVIMTPVTQWTLTSPSGTLSNLARPITDAQITFVTPQTCTVQIVGARRPRRTSQFAENRGVAARDLNQVLTDMIAQNRETWDKINDFTGRTLVGKPGETISPMPAASARANLVLGFDPTGLIPTMFAPGGGGSSGPVTIGTTTVINGTNTRVMFDNNGVFGEYTNAQLTALCQQFSNTLLGCVPSSGGGTSNFLRADGTWAAPGASAALQVGTTPISSGTTLQVLYNNAGVLGNYTNTQLTALINPFTPGLSGAVPSSGGGSVNFLRSDGSWAIPGPPGSTGQVPFNNAGTFGTSADLTFFDPMLNVGANGTNTGQLGFAGGTSGKVVVQAQPVAGAWTLQWPTSSGTAGFVLTTDGTGLTSWTNPVSGGTVTQVNTGGFLSGGPITTTGTVSGAALALPMTAIMGAL